VNELPKLSTLSEVAQALNLSPHTIRAWVRDGRLHPVRLCRRLLFDPKEITEFVSGKRTDSLLKTTLES
jgi:excisionase family DNA binding protein